MFLGWTNSSHVMEYYLRSWTFSIIPHKMLLCTQYSTLHLLGTAQ